MPSTFGGKGGYTSPRRTTLKPRRRLGAAGTPRDKRTR